MDVDKAGDIPLDNDKPQIVYEAVGADEVEVNSLSIHYQRINSTDLVKDY